MVEAYTKSPLTFKQQLKQLKDRDLAIDDDKLALFHLKTISYYRLSAYWHPFRKIEQDGTKSDYFEKGVHFNDVMTLYEFDRRLRLLVMDAIERVKCRHGPLLLIRWDTNTARLGIQRLQTFIPNSNIPRGWKNLRRKLLEQVMRLLLTTETNTPVFPLCQSGW